MPSLMGNRITVQCSPSPLVFVLRGQQYPREQLAVLQERDRRGRASGAREGARERRVALALEHRVRALQRSPAVREARACHVAHDAHRIRLTAALVVSIFILIYAGASPGFRLGEGGEHPDKNYFENF